MFNHFSLQLCISHEQNKKLPEENIEEKGHREEEGKGKEGRFYFKGNLNDGGQSY